jgi:hypothetical protein
MDVTIQLDEVGKQHQSALDARSIMVGGAAVSNDMA